MLSSHDVAAIMAQQQGMFAGTAQYAAQISASMPPAYQGSGTIGAYGFGGMPQAQFGGSGQQGGFSYATPYSGYGPGSMAGAAGTSAIAGAGKFGLGAIGDMAAFRGGMGAFGAARGMGMGFGGALGMGAMAAAPGLAFGAFAQHAMGSMVTGAQEQGGIERVLGQFNFSNSNSRTGRGFGRQEASAIGDMVRQMAHIPELMTSVSEITRIMDKVSQMGVMGGVRDASEFNRKFKEVFKTLKDVSKIMGTTTEEAAAFFGEARRSGIYTNTDIVKNAMNRQVTQGLTGMSQQQVAATQLAGSQMQHDMGGMRGTGARTALRTANQLGAMNQLGLLSNESIMELTGAGTPGEGIQQMTGQLQHAAHRMAKSSLGNVMTMALGETKEGRYTGRMDAELVARVRRGELSREDLMGLARQKTAGRGAKMSFIARRGHLTAEMAGQVGVEGMAMELERITKARGGALGDADAQRILMQRFGLGEAESGMVQELVKNLPMMQAQMRMTRGAEQHRISQNARTAEQSPDALLKKINTRIHNVLSAPFEKMGVAIRGRIADAVDDFIDSTTGRYQTQISDAAAQLLTSGKSQDRALAQQLGAGGKAFGVDRSGGALGGLLGKLSGQRGPQDLVMGSRFATRGQDKAAMLRGGIDVYGSKTVYGSGIRNPFAEEYTGMSASGMKQATDFYEGLDKGKIGASAEARLAGNRGDAETLAKEMLGISIDKGVMGLTGSAKRDAMLKALQGKHGGAFKRLFGGADSEDKAALLTRLGSMGGLGGSDLGLRGSDIAKELTGEGGGTSAEYSRRRADVNKSLQREFSGKDMGEDYADIQKAVLGGGDMTRLLAGKGGIFSKTPSMSAVDVNLVAMGGAGSAEAAKRLGIDPSKIDRGLLRRAMSARQKGLGMGDKGVEDLLRASLGEARSFGLEQQGAAGKEQADLLRGSKELDAAMSGGSSKLRGGVGALKDLEKILSGKKLFETSDQEIGGIAERLAGVSGKEASVLRGHMGDQAAGLAGIYSGTMGRLRGKAMSVSEIMAQTGLGREQVEGIVGGTGLSKGKAGDEARKKLSSLAASQALKRGILGKAGQGVTPEQMKTTFEKFGDAMKETSETMKKVGAVFQDFSGKQGKDETKS